MKKIWLFKLTLAAVSVGLAFLLGELLYSVYAGFNPVGFSLTAYNRPVAKFDPVRGYRQSPGPARVIRVERGHVVYDQQFRVNNMGWTSARDYTYRKPANTYRIIVFGDSFTSGEILSSQWPDMLHDILQGETAREQKFEVISFGFDGGGLANWHSVFFGEIVKNYEFDAIIIASWIDNLSRSLTVYHMDETRAFFGRFNVLPKSEEEFLATTFSQMQPLYSIMADETIDRILADRMKWQWPGFGLATKNAIKAYKDFNQIKRYKSEIEARRIDAAGYFADRNTLESRYARMGGLGKLWAMLDYAGANGIDIMFISIPDKELGKQDAITGGKAPNFHHIELASIARIYGAAYFNGYEVFRPFTPVEIEEKYWFKDDGHWNNVGARLFAEKIAAYVAEVWPPEAP